LTRPFVETAACPPGRSKVDFFDTGQRGFMLEVRASGGKTFYQRYTDLRGRERQFKIGPAAAIPLDQARRKARTILAEAILGADPQERRKELRLIPTLTRFVRERYLPHVKGYKRSWQTDETILRLHILPVFGRRPVDQVTSEAIADLLKRMREKGYASGTTNRVLVLLRYMFNLGRKWKIPGMAENPTAGLSTAPDIHRDRFLTVDETERLIAALEGDENQIAAQAILLLLLTGARRNEITHAKWEYVNWGKGALLVPLSKSGRPRTIALSGKAMELLRAIKPVPGNPYIFPSPVTGRPSPSLFFPWSRIRRKARLSGVRLHDLRHSFASFLVNQGVSLYIVQGLLGHRHPRTTQRYAHLAEQTLLEAAEVIATVVTGPNGEAKAVAARAEQTQAKTDGFAPT
jgi:integrase